MRHRLSSPSWTHRIPAGLPPGMPGIGLVIDGAVQQAPQLGRHASAESGLITGGEWGAAGTLPQGGIQPACAGKGACTPRVSS
jgi:hypothetical protein